MTTEAVDPTKRYLRFPPARPQRPAFARWLSRFHAIACLPFVLPLAKRRGVPGFDTRMRCIALGLRALGSGDLRNAFQLIAFPMDSFRYLEVDFARRAAREVMGGRYLDVSSPRLVPLMIIDECRSFQGELINPIVSDLDQTKEMVRSIGLERRCRARSAFIEHAPFADASFDLITSISVIEHIPGDTAAIMAMWRLLAPGGTLVVTVPCAQRYCDEYANLDEYQLLDKVDDGFVYWQRYYDEAALEQRIWSVTGRPVEMVIYGERKPGAYDANVLAKRTDPSYPYWREPLMLADEYRFYQRLAELPGMGVIAMRFVKSEAAPK